MIKVVLTLTRLSVLIISLCCADMGFPTPMEEPRKVIRCHYLGAHEVVRPTGMDVINEAIDWMYYRVPPEKWTFVNVGIAPSTIIITEHGVRSLLCACVCDLTSA
jgi:hypothetical protein